MNGADERDPQAVLDAAENGSTVRFDSAETHRVERPVQITTPGIAVERGTIRDVTRHGVRVADCTVARVAGNVVRGTAAGPGVAVAGGETVAVTDNAVRAAGPGIRVNASTDETFAPDNLAPDGSLRAER